MRAGWAIDSRTKSVWGLTGLFSRNLEPEPILGDWNTCGLRTGQHLLLAPGHPEGIAFPESQLPGQAGLLPARRDLRCGR